MFTLCVCGNLYGVVNTLTKASALPDNRLLNLAVTVSRAEPAALSLLFFLEFVGHSDTFGLQL